MDLAKFQKSQIDAEYELVKERTNSIAHGLVTCREYTARLESNSFYIASIAIEGQNLENLLRCLFEHYLSRRRMLGIRNVKDRFEHIKLEKLEDFTLGELIKKLKEFDFRDKKNLIPLLQEFNRWRVEAVHHAFDGSKEVEVFEDKAKTYLKGDSLEKINKGISNIFNDLGFEFQELIKNEA